MPTPLAEVCCARLPAASLAGLAEVRCVPGVEVVADGAACWLRWPAGSDEVLREVLPLPGVTLYVERGGQWYRFGSRLPTDGPPAVAAAQRLDRVVLPGRIEPVEAGSEGWQPVPLQFVRDEVPRAASALQCPLSVLEAWAEQASTVRLASFRAALDGATVLLLGSRLPLLPDSTRFWGRRVLVPLGFRPEPALPESALAGVLHLEGEDIALLRGDGVDVVPAQALRPLTRAGVRLASRGRAP